MKARLYKQITFLLASSFLVNTTTAFTTPVPPSSQTTSQMQSLSMMTPNVMIDTAPKPGMPSSSIKKSDPLSASSDENNIYLNFENASLASVLNYLGEERKINIIPHKDLENTKVSLTTRVPLTLNAAWNVLLTLLEMHGFTINQVGNVYRVVSNKENGTEPLAIYSSKAGMQPEQLPESDQVIRYVYFFQNIKVETAQGILQQMLEENSVQINQDLQVAVIKEKSFNIKAAMTIVKQLDTGGLRESIQIIKLNEADAVDVSKIFEQILGQEDKKGPRFMRAPGKKELTYFSTTTKIYAYPAKNSLILMGTEKNLQRITDFIYKNIDVPIGTAQSRLHIKEIRYAKCEQLKPILENIIRNPQGQGGEKSALNGQYKFFEDVIIAAETGTDEGGRGSGNRLIIACNHHDWQRLEKIIEKLDKPQPQVAFEILIVDLSETRFNDLGVQLQTKGKLGLGINEAKFLNLSQGANQKYPGVESYEIDLTNPIDLAANDKSSASFMSIGKPVTIDGSTPQSIGLWALIRSKIQIDQNNVISQPYIITNNGQPCTVEISQTQRVKAGLKTDKGVEPIATYVQKPVGTIMTLTPNINTNGVVNTKIDFNISSFVPSGTADLPGETNRTLSTTTSILAGEVLILGGLKNSQLTIGETKTPILGDIPLIGTFFKAKSRIKTETNLYIFIRPSIIKPQFENAPDEYTQLKLDYAKLNLMRNDLYIQDKDPIQRWFFRPSNQTVKQRVSDFKKGIHKPIDDYAFGKRHPRSVNIRKDPYFKISESLAKTEKPIHGFEELHTNQNINQHTNIKQRPLKIRKIS